MAMLRRVVWLFACGGFSDDVLTFGLADAMNGVSTINGKKKRDQLLQLIPHPEIVNLENPILLFDQPSAEHFIS
jgi:hypothetical protein